MNTWTRSQRVSATAPPPGLKPYYGEIEAFLDAPPQYQAQKEAAAQEQAKQEFLRAIYTTHPDIDVILTSREFAAWHSAQSRQDQDAITSIIERGSASQIIDLFNLYKNNMRALRNSQPTTVIEFDGSASYGDSQPGYAAQTVYQLYPYLNDSANGGRWSSPFKAWRQEYSSRGYSNPDFEAAKTVDQFRLDGYGACFPRKGSIERGECS